MEINWYYIGLAISISYFIAIGYYAHFSIAQSKVAILGKTHTTYPVFVIHGLSKRVEKLTNVVGFATGFYKGAHNTPKTTCFVVQQVEFLESLKGYAINDFPFEVVNLETVPEFKNVMEILLVYNTGDIVASVKGFRSEYVLH